MYILFELDHCYYTISDKQTIQLCDTYLNIKSTGKMYTLIQLK